MFTVFTVGRLSPLVYFSTGRGEGEEGRGGGEKGEVERGGRGGGEGRNGRREGGAVTLTHTRTVSHIITLTKVLPPLELINVLGHLLGCFKGLQQPALIWVRWGCGLE